jgi:transposase InsO family protein
VHAEKAHYPVRRICYALGISPSGYYAWCERPESRRGREDRRLLVHLRAAHAASRQTYGSPRLHAQLPQAGERVGRKRVIRLMRSAALTGRRRRRFRITTQADPTAVPANNRLNQRFTVDAPNRVWAGDITAIPTTDGWLYLAVLLDLYSRRVVGWAAGPTLETTLVLTAWHRACARRPAPQLHHSDRGAQYTSEVYQRALAAATVQCSMSRRGNCYDNAVVESFFRTLKSDLDDRLTGSRVVVSARLAAYIDGFYNSRRLHSSLNYQTPVAFERGRPCAA